MPKKDKKDRNEQITEILEAVQKIKEKLNPPLSEKIIRITGRIAIRVLFTIGLLVFAFNYGKIKKEDFNKCIENITKEMQKHIDDAKNSAYSIESCGDEKNLTIFSEKFDKTIQAKIQETNKKIQECVNNFVTPTENDMRRAIDNIF